LKLMNPLIKRTMGRQRHHDTTTAGIASEKRHRADRPSRSHQSASGRGGTG
jgi:hypothetical protein